MIQPLAVRLWRLPDETQCLELRDGRRNGWEVRVVRDYEVLKRAFFSDRVDAEKQGVAWLDLFASPVNAKR